MKKLLISISLIVVSFSLFVTIPVYASPNLQNAFVSPSDDNNRNPLDTMARGAGYNIEDGNTRLNTIIATVIQSALTLMGSVFFVLMVYGGYLWMTDRGNEEQVTKAKKLLTAAVIGIVIVIGAFAISYFVIERLTKGTLQAAPAGSVTGG